MKRTEFFSLSLYYPKLSLAMKYIVLYKHFSFILLSCLLWTVACSSIQTEDNIIYNPEKSITGKWVISSPQDNTEYYVFCENGEGVHHFINSQSWVITEHITYSLSEKEIKIRFLWLGATHVHTYLITKFTEDELHLTSVATGEELFLNRTIWRVRND